MVYGIQVASWSGCIETMDLQVEALRAEKAAEHLGHRRRDREPARQRARDLANTPSFGNAQRQRKKVEALFAELKNQIGLRRLRLRRKFVREQFFMAAAAQNIKRLVRYLSESVTPAPAATT